jgi:REP element-mobilizing transposase RayT
VFTDIAVARIAIREMRALEHEGRIRSLAWVLMPDHLHWLLQLGNGASLSRVMKSFKARSARKINRHLGRTGGVWQRAFHDRGLRENEDPWDMARYILGNPLRAGLVERVEEYPFWDSVWL